jgi:hypothetical protein
LIGMQVPVATAIRKGVTKRFSIYVLTSTKPRAALFDQRITRVLTKSEC